MGTNPLDALDLVRQRRGHDPINPYRIDDSAAVSEEERSEQDLIAKMAEDGPGAGEEVAARSGGDGQAPPPSPLIPELAPHIRAPKAAAPVHPGIPAPDFVVLILGHEVEAAVKGRMVSLTESDAKAVKTILLEAWKREVMAELKAVKGARRRKAQTAPRPNPESEVAVAPVRKRGRPKGSKNKPRDPA